MYMQLLVKKQPNPPLQENTQTLMVSVHTTVRFAVTDFSVPMQSSQAPVAGRVSLSLREETQ